MAHFWESAHSVNNERWDLHGILTGSASRIMLHAYRDIHERLPHLTIDDIARLRVFDNEPPWRDSVEEGLRRFTMKINDEMSGRAGERGNLADRLEAFRNGRSLIAGLASGMLEELSSAVEVLEGIGFPFALEELGVQPEDAYLPFRNIRLLRRRYSTFDLAYDVGLDAEMRESGRRYLFS